MGWSFCTGNRNLDAPDGKHCEKSENLASADTGIRNYRSGRNLYLPFEDERCGTGWVNDIAEGTKAAITGMDWAGLVLICFILPAVLSWAIAIPMRKCGWIKENDLKLDL